MHSPLWRTFSFLHLYVDIVSFRDVHETVANTRLKLFLFEPDRTDIVEEVLKTGELGYNHIFCLLFCDLLQQKVR